MDWEAIGAIGEIVGAAAVVATLGYLAVQIGQNTERERLAQEFLSNQYFNELRMLVASDSELAGIEMRGVADLSSLTPLERHRFDELMVSWVWAMQKAYRQMETMKLATDFSEGVSHIIRRRFDGPGFSNWWSGAKGEFTDTEFRAAIDELLDSSGSIA